MIETIKIVTGSQTPKPEIDLKDCKAYRYDKLELSWVMAGIYLI